MLAALFTSASARTAGFNAIDIGALSVESLNLHYLLMFIGGGSAGTAGGVKVTTFFVLLLVVWSEVRGNQDVQNLEASVLTILNLSQMGIKDIWAKANNAQHGRIAERVGAHHVVYPESDMGGRVAHSSPAR